MKASQYFPHDANARHDEKIVELRMKHGWEGYGLYWAICEKLREASDYRLSVNFNLLAFDLRTTNEMVKSIVSGFGLFTIEEDHFYSQSLCERMSVKDEASDRARQKALKRWGNKPGTQPAASGNDAAAMLQHSPGNAIKESKVKKEEKGGDAGVDAPARAPSEDWPGLTDQQGWVATQLNNLTEGKLPRDYVQSEAVKLIAKKREPHYPYIISWAKIMAETYQRISAGPLVADTPAAPQTTKVTTGRKTL